MFGDPGPAVDLNGDYVCFHIPGLRLPRRGMSRDDQLPEELLGQAILCLVAAYSRRVLFRHSDRFAALRAWVDFRSATRPANHRSATDSNSDGSYLNSLVLPHLGDKPIGSVQPSDLEAWVADLMAEGKAPATVQKAWQIASGVFRWAVRDRLIALSPARDVRLPKIERSEPIAFTVEEVMRLGETIDPRYRALVLVGAFGGLRIGEMAGLQLGDFETLAA